MSASSPRSRSHDEAAEWITRLNRSVVDQGDLARFRDWRQRPGNEAAFQDLRRTWRDLGMLADDAELADELRRLAERKSRRRGWLLPSAAALGGLCAASVILLYIGAGVLLPRSDTYTTGVGERSVVRLADGSIVHLDTDSLLTARVTRRARSLQLARGQALFEVAHDPGRPFVVTAGAMSVRATGTRFDVRRDISGSSHVVLLEGQVRVSDRHEGGRTWTLAPGQALRIERSPLPTRPTTVNVQDATSWTSGVLTFRDEPLADLVAETNRYSRTRLELVPDAALAKLRVDGVFNAGDVEATAASLKEIYDLSLARRPDGTIVLGRRIITVPRPPASPQSE